VHGKKAIAGGEQQARIDIENKWVEDGKNKTPSSKSGDGRFIRAVGRESRM